MKNGKLFAYYSLEILTMATITTPYYIIAVQQDPAFVLCAPFSSASNNVTINQWPGAGNAGADYMLWEIRQSSGGNVLFVSKQFPDRAIWGGCSVQAGNNDNIAPWLSLRLDPYNNGMSGQSVGQTFQHNWFGGSWVPYKTVITCLWQQPSYFGYNPIIPAGNSGINMNVSGAGGSGGLNSGMEVICFPDQGTTDNALWQVTQII